MVTVEVREARQEDLPHIVPWASDTFEWGDYVPERFAEWLQVPESAVFVVPDDTDRPVALCHAVMLSADEGWLEGARVHPDHRRHGFGTALNHAGSTWLGKRGARVVRLAVEAQNAEAQAQVEKLGYRPVAVWHHGDLRVDPTRRCPPAYRLQPTAPSEIDAAWVFWAGGELAKSGRELLAAGWQWARMRPQHLQNAASQGRLYQSPAGWIIAERPQPDVLCSGWMATVAEDAPRLLEGLTDLGVELGVEEVRVMVPGSPWLVEALVRAGGQTREILIYAKAPAVSSETPSPR